MCEECYPEKETYLTDCTDISESIHKIRETYENFIL